MFSELFVIIRVCRYFYRNNRGMKKFFFLALLFTSTLSHAQDNTGILPRHSIHGGVYFTTQTNNGGPFLDYQYFLDDQISYSLKPGMTGLVFRNDSMSIFFSAGMNYRFLSLRKPLKDRFFNFEPYTGFYPVTLDYLMINTDSEDEPDSRFGLTPSGIIGFTLIFANMIDLDLHAGFGISFRMGGKAGEPIQPDAFAGISLGYRF
jgi:hypothetical protein